jgi:hypothetical protein
MIQNNQLPARQSGDLLDTDPGCALTQNKLTLGNIH